MSRIKIDLQPKIDGFGKKYFVGKLRGPFVIDCNEKTTGGACFLVFLSEEGCEELQIAPISNNNNNTKPKKPKVYKIAKKIPNE